MVIFYLIKEVNEDEHVIKWWSFVLPVSSQRYFQQILNLHTIRDKIVVLCANCMFSNAFFSLREICMRCMYLLVYYILYESSQWRMFLVHP